MSKTLDEMIVEARERGERRRKIANAVAHDVCQHPLHLTEEEARALARYWRRPGVAPADVRKALVNLAGRVANHLAGGAK